MAGIEIERISKRFAEVTAVRHLSLAVADHEFVTLLGPSGCGKTTLLRLIALRRDLPVARARSHRRGHAPGAQEIDPSAGDIRSKLLPGAAGARPEPRGRHR
jgi:ABC-type taurine transport system ATPase subunit